MKWGLVLGAALGTKLLLIASAFVWVVLYAHVLHTGEDAAFYERYAQDAGPWVAILVGLPAFFLVTRWLAGKDPSHAIGGGLLMWGSCVVLDVPLAMVAGASLTGVLCAVGWGTSLLASLVGARLG